MNKIPNKKAICDALIEKAKTDKDIILLFSDSRGSASMGDFIDTFPEQYVEVGIAEQSLVSISAGLARCGKKAFAVSPSCFLASRSNEQVKVDVAYSDTNVKLIGISGGVSYGALGMTHHSLQDIASISSIPNMRMYIPSDRHQTKKIIDALLDDEKPAYIRVGRNPVEDIYSEEDIPFELDKSTVLLDGSDIGIVVCGEMVKPAYDAALILKEKGINCTVLDMYCVKPIDTEAIVETAQKTKAILTVEEHVKIGGMGSMVCQVLSNRIPRKVVNMALPDEPVITGTSKQVFDYYGLNSEGIMKKCMELLKNE